MGIIKIKNANVVKQFESNLRLYYSQESVGSIPSVAYFAGKANLSTSSFSDLIRRETGSSPKELISLFIVDEAKRCLTEADKTISEIAYRLGFTKITLSAHCKFFLIHSICP